MFMDKPRQHMVYHASFRSKIHKIKHKVWPSVRCMQVSWEHAALVSGLISVPSRTPLSCSRLSGAAGRQERGGEGPVMGSTSARRRSAGVTDRCSQVNDLTPAGRAVPCARRDVFSRTPPPPLPPPPPPPPQPPPQPRDSRQVYAAVTGCPAEAPQMRSLAVPAAWHLCSARAVWERSCSTTRAVSRCAMGTARHCEQEGLDRSSG